jgi:L-ribulose-5-phosphate 3-epimerase
MISNSIVERLAVCSWSLEAKNPVELAEKMRATGIARVQLALDPLRTAPELWAATESILHRQGIQIVSGMFGCVGEDYSTLETIRATGGIAPDETWAQNRENIRATAALAESLGLNLVTFHAGFFPVDEHTPGFRKMVERLQMTADTFASRKIQVGLETGQESAAELAAMLRRVDRPNLGVNFDPANIILYGRQDGIEALRLLAPWLRQVHVKDATPAATPGTWGEEVVVGTGAVDWAAFFTTLKSLNFAGHAVIEREAGANRLGDICAAKKFIESLFR